MPRRCGAALELENAGYLEVHPYAFLLEKHKETERYPNSTYKGAAAVLELEKAGYLEVHPYAIWDPICTHVVEIYPLVCSADAGYL